MEKYLPRVIWLRCWNHTINAVKAWLKKHGASSVEIPVYISHLRDLLNQRSACLGFPKIPRQLLEQLTLLSIYKLTHSIHFHFPHVIPLPFHNISLDNYIHTLPVTTPSRTLFCSIYCLLSLMIKGCSPMLRLGCPSGCVRTLLLRESEAESESHRPRTLTTSAAPQ